MTRAKTQSTPSENSREQTSQYQLFTAETQSTLREEFLPNRETTIGQNLRASREICFCLSSSPDKQKSHSLRLCGDFLNELAVRRYALGALLFAITHLR